MDAPSGTALALADAMNDVLSDAYRYKYDRSTERKKRDKYEIGISAVRGGSIVGEHEVIFAGLDEVLTFTHTAYSRSVFGKGAVEAQISCREAGGLLRYAGCDQSAALSYLKNTREKVMMQMKRIRNKGD